jgi:hypothetical protein
MTIGETSTMYNTVGQEEHLTRRRCKRREEKRREEKRREEKRREGRSSRAPYYTKPQEVAIEEEEAEGTEVAEVHLGRATATRTGHPASAASQTPRRPAIRMATHSEDQLHLR